MSDLKGLPAAAKEGLRAKRHPSGPFLILFPGSWEADQAAYALAERYGRVRWTPKGWTIDRPQLRLPGF